MSKGEWASIGVLLICLGIWVVTGSWQWGAGIFLILVGIGGCLVSLKPDIDG